MIIAIVGAGPAGCHLAHLLANTEHEILLFDHRVPYEKPCGGGLSPLVGRRFPDVMALPFPRHRPRCVVLRSADGGEVEHELNSLNWAIVSRAEFGRALLERALENGRVHHVRQRVSGVAKAGKRWSLRTVADQEFSADFLVGADGVHSVVRRKVVGPIPSQHLALGVGYRVRGVPDAIIFQTYSDLEGYLWSFPRPDHASVGIATRLDAMPSRELWHRVDGFLAEICPDAKKRSSGLAGCRWLRMRACGRHPALGQDGRCSGMRQATSIPSPASASPTRCGRRSCWRSCLRREICWCTAAFGRSSMEAVSEPPAQC